MKKYFLLFCILTLALSSCRKKIDDTVFDAAAQAVVDDQILLDYFLLNGIPKPVKDPSGLYYTIVDPGTGPKPTVSSNITVEYHVYNTDNTEVDQSASHYFAPLDGLIDAWRIAIPKIGKSGTILLYAPSGLAYGPQGNGNIGANKVLLFKITLQGFNN
ncbi:FKBP-type peptidyl-prolyl cis-trans isomerase [Mucilaginibacter antarcticus]